MRAASGSKKAKGIGFIDAVAIVFGDNMVLIDGAAAQPGDKAFPDSGAVLPDLQGMRCLVPAVEVTKDRDLFGIWCPYGEMRPGCAP